MRGSLLVARVILEVRLAQLLWVILTEWLALGVRVKFLRVALFCRDDAGPNIPVRSRVAWNRDRDPHEL